MTPEEARKLLDGITPAPWKAEILSYEQPPYLGEFVEFWVTAHNNKELVNVYDIPEWHANEIGRNFTLMAAAPDMAAIIAGMRAEYAVQVRRSGGWQYSRDEDDFRWQDLSVQMVRADRDHPHEETRLVRRYVTAPQPLEGEHP